MSDQLPSVPDRRAELRRVAVKANRKIGELLERPLLDEVRSRLRKSSSDAARRFDLPVLDDAGEALDRALARLHTAAKRLQRRAQERLDRGDEPPPPERATAPLALPAPSAHDPTGGAGSKELDVQASKFDLDRRLEAAVEPGELPWGYGRDRVTAMFVDSDRLYTYWEVTDPAIEDARQRLGQGGPTAWLSLRVYDVTGRLFDGTNAHSYFDHRIDRADRQWFFAIGKPGSSVVVDLGLKSYEGYFVKIIRSGRVEFPRRESQPGGDIEWLTVRPGTLETSVTFTEGRAAHAPSQPGDTVPVPLWARDGGAERGDQGNDADRAVALLPGQAITRRWDWQIVFPGDWWEIRRILHWEGPLARTSWEAGPFFVPVELPSRIEEYHSGETRVSTQDGVTHVVYGPWQVVIRGIDAHGERRVLATWWMQRSWPAALVHAQRTEWRQVANRTGAEAIAAGASEGWLVGASESLVRGASETWLGGASEVYLLGASEIRFGGASETIYAGASERRLGGASELRFGGASERLLRGASEQILPGASELLGAGASERRLGGASELERGGASEQALSWAREG